MSRKPVTFVVCLDKIAVIVIEQVAFFEVFTRIRRVRYFAVIGSIRIVIICRRAFACRCRLVVFYDGRCQNERGFAVRLVKGHGRGAVELSRSFISAPRPDRVGIVVCGFISRNNEGRAVDFVLVGVEVFMADRAVIVPCHTVARRARGNFIYPFAVIVIEQVAFFEVFTRIRRVRYFAVIGSIRIVIICRRAFACRCRLVVFYDGRCQNERGFAVRLVKGHGRGAVELSRSFISAPRPDRVGIVVCGFISRNNEGRAVDFVLVGVEVFMADRAVIVPCHTVARRARGNFIYPFAVIVIERG